MQEHGPVELNEILVKEFMEPLGLSSEQLAERLGIDVAELGRPRGEWREQVLEGLAQELGGTGEFWRALAG